MAATASIPGAMRLPRQETDMQGVVVYGIPNCDTVKRARSWLEAQGVTYTFHDFKREIGRAHV